MHDVECPYCKAEQDIDHDDGQGYAEGIKHKQTCPECENTFVFQTIISFSYEVNKAECLNGGEHQYKPSNTYPKQYTRMYCNLCDRERNPTDEEMKQILNS